MNWKMRVLIKALMCLIALMLAFLGVAFAGWAVYLALDVHYPADTAALLTAAVALCLLLVMILVAVLFNSRERSRTVRTKGDVDQLEDLFRAAVDPAVAGWIRKNPAAALALSLIAGVAVSYTGNSNTVIRDLLAVVSEAARDTTTQP